jgi:hypothetical protein
VPETRGHDDVPTCERLVRDGWLLAAVDIADHWGEEVSTWGNQSALYAKPLDTKGVRVTSLGGEG